MDPWLLALLVFLAYAAGLIILGQTGLLRRANIQVVGPLLIWRTGKGRALLERIARFRRFWGLFSRFSVYLVFFSMFATVVLVLWQAYLVTTQPTPPVNPQYAIGIPGINPIIPVGYGIVGLAVAILVHEGCHGILARAEDIKVRSVGLMLLIVPIGAFVEPEESEMRAAPIARRQRIFAVGPASNIILALLCAWIFSAAFIGSVEQVEPGVVIHSVMPGGPAEAAGVQPYTILMGVQIAAPANNSTPTPMVMVKSTPEFEAFMANAQPNDTVTVALFRDGNHFNRSFVLAARPADVLALYPQLSRAIMGISLETFPLTVAGRPGANAAQNCGGPGEGLGSRCYSHAVALYIAMPVSGDSPIRPEVAALYRPVGPLAALGGAFWVLADMFYWLFWLNFMVGIFNSLPLYPLDGGHMYKDAVLSLLRKRKAAGTAAESSEAKDAREKEEASRPKSPADDLFGTPRRLLDPLDRRAHTITMYTSLMVLTLVLWQFIAPSLGLAGAA
jgi:membrane-associated protease RseP (regulator of RpoE activity)